MRARRGISIVFAAAALAACTSGSGADDPAPEIPSQPVSAQPSPDASDPSGAVGATIPGCEELLTAEDLSYYFPENSGAAEIVPTPAGWGPPEDHMADDHLRPLMAQAQDPASCTWGIPGTDNFFTIIIAHVTPALASDVGTEIANQGYPDMHPPTRGYAFEDAESNSSGVHLIENEFWLVFQGGPGSINADDAERHGFATVLGNVSDRISN